jgi:ketosteroid isomerase-like protein
MTAQEEVLDAARRLIEAFGSHDVPAYFGSFAADATFVFHNHPVPLASRADYEAVWRGWEQEGFHVEGCTSSDQNVHLLTPEVAVFTHSVSTRLAGDEAAQRERETIVFRRDPSGRWLGVHEHLSVDPVDPAGEADRAVLAP